MLNTTIAGCGYVGTRLAKTLLAQNHVVRAITRSAERQQSLQRMDIASECLDFDTPILQVTVPDGAVLVYCVPPPLQGQEDPRLGRFLDALTALPQHIVLISTTGVYGDCHGAWIDEDTPLQPQVDRAWRRMDAEQRLTAWCAAHQVTRTILRVPGIYGPGKLPRARLERQQPVLAEADSPYSNRIHVDDLVSACIAALRIPGVFHLSDGQPSTMTDYFNHVADALQLPRPPQLSAAQAAQQLSQEMQGYLAESKRLDITRMRTILGVEPRYTALAEGLAQCVAEERQLT